MLETTSFIIFSGLVLDVTFKSAKGCIMSHNPFRGCVSSAVRSVALKLLPAAPTKRYVSYHDLTPKAKVHKPLFTICDTLISFCFFSLSSFFVSYFILFKNVVMTH